MVQNAPNYQQFGRFYEQSQQTFGPTEVALPYQYYNYAQPNQQISFLATLDFLDLSNLINDPIQHDPFCPTISGNISPDSTKVDGK